MKTRGFQARQLDVVAMGQQQAQLAGDWPLTAFVRLLSGVLAVPPGALVTWSAQAEARRTSGAAPQTWLHLEAHTQVTVVCQRCLQPMPVPLVVDRWFRFVRSEEEADKEDFDAQEDVLVETHRLDLQSLIEDELLMAMPMVPMHSECGAPVGAVLAALNTQGQDEALDEPEELESPRENPFAVLARMKRAH